MAFWDVPHFQTHLYQAGKQLLLSKVFFFVNLQLIPNTLWLFNIAMV